MCKRLGPVEVRHSKYPLLLLLLIGQIISSYVDCIFLPTRRASANYIQTGFVDALFSVYTKEQIEFRKDWLKFGVCG